MKNLYFLILFLTLLTGCKYGSYKEASDACKKWVEKGDKYSIRGYYGGLQRKDIRDCLNEDITKQILGIEYPIEVGNYQYYDQPKRNRSDSKVKKRFQY